MRRCHEKNDSTISSVSNSVARLIKNVRGRFLKAARHQLFKIQKVSRAKKQTRDLLILFTFSFHHFTAEPQRLPG
jgi:hypothetical protein